MVLVQGQNITLQATVDNAGQHAESAVPVPRSDSAGQPNATGLLAHSPTPHLALCLRVRFGLQQHLRGRHVAPTTRPQQRSAAILGASRTRRARRTYTGRWSVVRTESR